jgi:FixJ family two-component response regulator
MMNPESRRHSIAIVDDDASLLISLARNLRIAGFDVRTFASAEEYLAYDAIAIADVLLADLRLPGMGGIELSMELARRGITTAVIFMTGHSQQETARELDSIGLPTCLRKPFEAKELRAAIKLALVCVTNEAK